MLLTREEPGARPLADVLAESAAPAARRRLAVAFGRFLAGLHAAGVAHPDPHPGNVLVTPAGEFLLTDVHAVRFAPGRLGWPAARADLVGWNRYFQLRATAADRARFWRAYSAGRPDRRRAAEVEAGARASNLRFWTNRLTRHTAANRDTRPVRGPAGTGFAARDWRPDLLAAWLADPDAAFASPPATLWKNSRSATVAPVTVETAAGPAAAVAKRFNPKSAAAWVKNALRASPARRSWVLGHNLLDRGLPTARPLLVVERRRLGVPRVGYLVTERVPGAVELPAAVRALGTHPAGRRVARAWADRLGRVVRQMHAAEVTHRDLKAANVLMRGAATDPAAATPVLIDLVGVTVGRPVRRATRVRDVARLAASFVASPDVTNGTRLTLLLAYLGPGVAWKPWWRAIAAAVAAKVEKNRRTGRPLA